MSDILDLIDNAIDDYTSSDAMRWTPDRPKAKQLDQPELAMRRLVAMNALGVRPERIIRRLGRDEVQAAFAEMGRKFAAVAAALKPVIEQIGRSLTVAFGNLGKFQAAVERENAARRVRVSRMHAAYGRRRR